LALKYSLRWSSRDLSCGVIGLSACIDTYFLAKLVEVEALPSHRVLLSRWSSVQYGLLRLLIWLPPGFHLFGLYHSLRWLWATDRMRSLLFRRLLSQHPVLLTPEGSSRLHFQALRRFHRLRWLVSSSAPSFSLSG
jgi:hypothetical protein